MAAIGRSVFSLMRHSAGLCNTSQRVCFQQFVRHKCITETGGVLPSPSTVRFGLPKVITVIFPFLYIGATISKEGAAFLEEYDIFVPEDDD